MALFQEKRDNEFFDMIKLGWLEEGSGEDVGKYRLSAKGLEAFERFVKSSAAKDRVLTQLKVEGNAYKTADEVKGFMG